MVSDLHISNNWNKCLNILLKRIDKIFDVINRESGATEELTVVMCGDVVDKGKIRYYNVANKIFEYLKQKAGNRNIEFVMVPGNHDLNPDCGFKAFDDFCEEFQNGIGKFVDGSCYSKIVNSFNFILSNSTYHKSIYYGQVDTESIIENVNPYLNNILITHHSPFSEDTNDTANIRNVIRLFDVINDKNIIFHLHGHTHGTYITSIAENCKSVGVGAMFLKAKEMGSQFHILSVENEKIVSIYNYYYRIDLDKYVPVLIYPDKSKNDNNAYIICDEYLGYTKPENYIIRKVGPFDIVQQGGISLFYNKEQIKSLKEIIYEKKHVVLIGDAGSGKSYELNCLAYVLSSERKLVPIFIQLNDYVDYTIESLIEKNYKKDINYRFVLIFDGFDEIEDKNLNTFAKRLNLYVKGHPEQEIIVSTRNNFYRNAIDQTNAGTFNNFFEYTLCPLTDADIIDYLRIRDVNDIHFLNEIKKKKLKEQIQNPFFLVQLVDLYIYDNDLPVIEQLMDKLINKMLKQDENKYITTKDIDSRRSEILFVLEELAFAMQCLKKNYLDSEEYQQLISKDKRDLLMYTGIWCKVNGSQWKFEHNNFREFLAAKYLTKKTLNEIKMLVTYSENQHELKASWSNTLSFLILVYLNQELVDWLVDTAPSIIVKFETSRLDTSIRTKILCKILDEYKNNNMWITRNQNDIEDLAKFGQSDESIDYLINEITFHANFRSQSNALHIIGAITNYYSKVTNVRNALIACCFNAYTRNYEIRAAIMALTNLELFSEGDIYNFIKYFANEKDSEIRYALYCYIIEFNLQEIAIDFIVDGIKIINSHNGENYSERSRVQEILKMLDTYEAIHKVFQYIIQSNDYHETIQIFDDTIETLCYSSEKIYTSGKTEILEDIIQLFIISSTHCEHRIMNSTKKFLVNTNEVFKTYKIILNNIKGENLIFNLEDIMDEKCIENFLYKYKNDMLENKEYFISFVQRYRRGNYKYNELRDAVLHKDGLFIEEKEIIDYEALKKIGEQKFFDALFLISEFNKLILELVELCNGTDTLYEDLEHISFRRLNKRYDLDKVHWAISNVNFEDRKVINFLDHILSWEFFSIHNIYKELSNNKTILVSKEQENIITDYCLKSIGNIDFDKEFTFTKEGTTSFSWRAVWCMYFAERFSIEYEHSIILNMLIVPAFIFHKEKTEELIFSNYVTNRLSKKEIEDQIHKNLKEKNIVGSLAEMYIKYCKIKGLQYAVDLAYSVILDESYTEWIRRISLEYLIDIKGRDFILEKYLPDSNTNLLNLIVDNFTKHKNEKLINRLVEENKNSNDGLLYLKYLILMNNEFGLKKYYDIAKQLNTLPDMTDENDIFPITEAISEVSEIVCLPIIIDLVLLVFKKGFNDKQYFGLYNSVSKAITKISETNPGDVLVSLESAKSDNLENEEFLSYCNHNLLEIRTLYYNQRDLPWSIDKIKQYIYM
jgi:energy-coupling factor transporter ATP-binding protein EcfA2